MASTWRTAAAIASPLVMCTALIAVVSAVVVVRHSPARTLPPMPPLWTSGTVDVELHPGRATLTLQLTLTADALDVVSGVADGRCSDDGPADGAWAETHAAPGVIAAAAKKISGSDVDVDVRALLSHLDGVTAVQAVRSSRAFDVEAPQLSDATDLVVTAAPRTASDGAVLSALLSTGAVRFQPADHVSPCPMLAVSGPGLVAFVGRLALVNGDVRRFVAEQVSTTDINAVRRFSSIAVTSWKRVGMDVTVHIEARQATAE
jgi:hypothetical protein